jgi:hypothetical protein
LGYPAPNEPSPVKKRREGKITYYDTYGRVTNTDPSQKREKNSLSPEQYLFEYSLFLLTAARGIPSELRIYGAIRLLDAISRVTGLYSTISALKPDPFLIDAKEKNDSELDTAMVS